MRLLPWLTFLPFAPVLGVFAVAREDLDCVKVDPKHHKVEFENDHVRVVRWFVPVGGKTLKHSHPDSLNINLTDYNGRVTAPDGKTFDVHDKAGSVSWRPALIHVVENTGGQPMEGIIVEPREQATTPQAGGD